MPTDLQVKAQQAVAEVGVTGPGGILPAIKVLRDRTAGAHTLRDLKKAVEWALDHPSAADLPDGSVVASDRVAYIKNHPSDTAAWRGTNQATADDVLVNDLLASGAVALLRIGRGEAGSR